MLKFYTLNNKYNEYLKSFDFRVMSNYNIDIERPYVGLLFRIKSYNYYAPMTSPKQKHLTMKNMLDFEKIDNGKFGAINFNNMIPVSNKVLNYINIDNVEDDKYKQLLDNQFRWVNKNSKLIIDKANKLYELYVTNRLSSQIFNRCCDFKLLEEKCKLYIPEFYIYQDREQSKLVVFTEEKKEERYNLYGIAEVPKDQIGIVIGVKQLSDKTTFALIDEDDKDRSFYSTITNKVYGTINKLNEEVQSISQ